MGGVGDGSSILVSVSLGACRWQRAPAHSPGRTSNLSGLTSSWVTRQTEAGYGQAIPRLGGLTRPCWPSCRTARDRNADRRERPALGSVFGEGVRLNGVGAIGRIAGKPKCNKRQQAATRGKSEITSESTAATSPFAKSLAHLALRNSSVGLRSRRLQVRIVSGILLSLVAAPQCNGRQLKALSASGASRL
jgi:hypothetical protein